LLVAVGHWTSETWESEDGYREGTSCKVHDPKYPETELHVHVTRYYYLSNNAKGRPGEIARCDGLFESHKGEIWMYNTFMWRPERVRTG
jgi:hypothetical protein